MVDLSEIDGVKAKIGRYREKIERMKIYIQRNQLKLGVELKSVIKYAENFKSVAVTKPNLFFFLASEAFSDFRRCEYFLNGEINIYQLFEDLYSSATKNFKPAQNGLRYLKVWKDIFRFVEAVGQLTIMVCNIFKKILEYVWKCIDNTDEFIADCLAQHKDEWSDVPSDKKDLMARELYFSIHYANNALSYFEKAIYLLSFHIYGQSDLIVMISKLDNAIESQEQLMNLEIFAIDSDNMNKVEEVLKNMESNESINILHILQHRKDEFQQRLDHVLLTSTEEVISEVKKRNIMNRVKFFSKRY